MSKRARKKQATIRAMRALAMDMHTVSYMVGDFSNENAEQLRGASNMMNEWADCLENEDTGRTEQL